MDERDDYDDGDTPVEQVVPEWLHVPLAFVAISCCVFAMELALGAVFR